MNGWLLDTNVLSELNRPTPTSSVVEFVLNTRVDRLFISVVTIAEIRFGIATAKTPTRKVALDAWFRHEIRGMFADRVLALSEDLLLQWRLMAHRSRGAGRACSEADLLIAATADHHGLVLATRDSVFRRLDLVSTFDPWSGSTHRRQADERGKETS